MWQVIAYGSIGLFAACCAQGYAHTVAALFAHALRLAAAA